MVAPNLEPVTSYLEKLPKMEKFIVQMAQYEDENF
jgi:hypothetical protein